MSGNGRRYSRRVSRARLATVFGRLRSAVISRKHESGGCHRRRAPLLKRTEPSAPFFERAHVTQRLARAAPCLGCSMAITEVPRRESAVILTIIVIIVVIAITCTSLFRCPSACFAQLIVAFWRWP